MKHTLIKIKKNLQGNNNRVDEAKNQINDLKYKEAKNNQSKQEKRIQNNTESVRSLRDNIKHSNTSIMGVSEGEEKEQEIVNIYEKIMKLT